MLRDRDKSDPVAKMGCCEGWDHCNCVIDRALSNDCLEIERGSSATASDRVDVRDASRGRTTELLLGTTVEVEAAP